MTNWLTQPFTGDEDDDQDLDELDDNLDALEDTITVNSRPAASDDLPPRPRSPATSSEGEKETPFLFGPPQMTTRLATASSRSVSASSSIVVTQPRGRRPSSTHSIQSTAQRPEYTPSRQRSPTRIIWTADMRDHLMELLADEVEDGGFASDKSRDWKPAFERISKEMADVYPRFSSRWTTKTISDKFTRERSRWVGVQEFLAKYATGGAVYLDEDTGRVHAPEQCFDDWCNIKNSARINWDWMRDQTVGHVPHYQKVFFRHKATGRWIRGAGEERPPEDGREADEDNHAGDAFDSAGEGPSAASSRLQQTLTEGEAEDRAEGVSASTHRRRQKKRKRLAEQFDPNIVTEVSTHSGSDTALVASNLQSLRVRNQQPTPSSSTPLAELGRSIERAAVTAANKAPVGAQLVQEAIKLFRKSFMASLSPKEGVKVMQQLKDPENANLFVAMGDGEEVEAFQKELINQWIN